LSRRRIGGGVLLVLLAVLAIFTWQAISASRALLGARQSGELVQQRGELSLHLDHGPGLVQLRGQPLILPPQPGQIAISSIRCRVSGGLAQRLQRALVTLLAPGTDQRGVQAFAAQQRALAGPVQRLVLGQDLLLVGRGVPAPLSPSRPIRPR